MVVVVVVEFIGWMVFVRWVGLRGGEEVKKRERKRGREEERTKGRKESESARREKREGGIKLVKLGKTGG